MASEAAPQATSEDDWKRFLVSTAGFSWIRSSSLLIHCTCMQSSGVLEYLQMQPSWIAVSVTWSPPSGRVSIRVELNGKRNQTPDGDADWNKPNLKLSRLTSTNLSELELLVHGIISRRSLQIKLMSNKDFALKTLVAQEEYAKWNSRNPKRGVCVRCPSSHYKPKTLVEERLWFLLLDFIHCKTMKLCNCVYASMEMLFFTFMLNIFNLAILANKIFLNVIISMKW